MSKFAVLKVEGLTDSEEEEEEKPKAPAQSKESAKKQKRKKKKKKSANSNSESNAADSWSEWKRKDEQQAETQFRQDLEEALLASRVETDATGDLPGMRASALEDSAAALTREKRQEQLRQDVEVERRVQLRLQAAVADKDAVIADKDAVIADKDAVIADKDAELDALRSQCQQLRGESERLESFIRLVEGRKGEGLCQQVSELSQVIAELTEHIGVLDTDLAKERTRCHQLQTQLDKIRQQ